MFHIRLLTNLIIAFDIIFFSLFIFIFFFRFELLSFIDVITWDTKIDLKHINQTKGDNNKVELGIDLREFYPSVEWDILGVPAERHEKYYPCCAEPYPGK